MFLVTAHDAISTRLFERSQWIGPVGFSLLTSPSLKLGLIWLFWKPALVSDLWYFAFLNVFILIRVTKFSKLWLRVCIRIHSMQRSTRYCIGVPGIDTIRTCYATIWPVLTPGCSQMTYTIMCWKIKNNDKKKSSAGTPLGQPTSLQSAIFSQGKSFFFLN